MQELCSGQHDFGLKSCLTALGALRRRSVVVNDDAHRCLGPEGHEHILVWLTSSKDATDLFP